MTTFYPLPLVSHEEWISDSMKSARRSFGVGSVDPFIHSALSRIAPGYEQDAPTRKLNLLVGAIADVAAGNVSEFFAGLNGVVVTRASVIRSALKLSDPFAISHLNDTSPGWKASIMRASGKYDREFAQIDRVAEYLSDRGHLPHPKDGNLGRELWVSAQMVLSRESHRDIVTHVKDSFPGLVEPVDTLDGVSGMVRELCLFSMAFGREPRSGSMIETENRLARRMKQVRRSASALRTPDLQALARYYGGFDSVYVPDSKDEGSEIRFEDSLSSLVSWVRDNGRAPSRRSDDGTEVSMRHLLDNLRRGRDMSSRRARAVVKANEALSETGVQI